MPQCCPKSPLFYLYPGRPMEQTFFYTRDNIPHEPPIPRNLVPQISGNHTIPRTGAQPLKMAAIDPQMQIDYPESWWEVPREPFAHEDEPLIDSPSNFMSTSAPRKNTMVHPHVIFPILILFCIVLILAYYWVLKPFAQTPSAAGPAA